MMHGSTNINIAFLVEFYQSHFTHDLHASKYFVFSGLKQYLVQGLQLYSQSV